MESSDELPPLTFEMPAFRQSQKKHVTPCDVRLAVSPIHTSAIGFIAAALAKQIMFARGRINQSFSELESFVQVGFNVELFFFFFSSFLVLIAASFQSEIQAVAEIHRVEASSDSIDAGSTNEYEGMNLIFE
jgi:hypothetical protein